MADNYYVIILRGAAGSKFKIVDEESFKWIQHPPPRFENKRAPANEHFIPETIKRRLHAAHVQKNGASAVNYEDFQLELQPHSYMDDRANACVPLTVNGVSLEFDTFAELVDWFHQNHANPVTSWRGRLK